MRRYELMSKEEIIGTYSKICAGHPCSDCRAYIYCEHNQNVFTKKSYGCKEIVRDYLTEEIKDVCEADR